MQKAVYRRRRQVAEDQSGDKAPHSKKSPLPTAHCSLPTALRIPIQPEAEKERRE